MPKRFIAIILTFGILGLSIPMQAHAQFGIGSIKTVIDTITTVIGFVNLPKQLGVSGYIPHNFPFGGPILTKESACSLSFRPWFPSPFCLFGFCALVTIGSISVIRFGDAIRIGDPLPVVPPTTVPYGRIITFPFVSDTYDWQTHDRSGPWALGLGFTPFPLDKLNDALSGLRFPPPSQLPCAGRFTPAYFWCVDNISISCKDSGETDTNGNPIYKVIRLIGTSNMDAPASVFPTGYPQ